MRTSLFAVATLAVAALAPAVPAHAADEPLGANGCSATALSAGGRAYCSFAAETGTYELVLDSGARYSFARIFCNEQLPAVAVAIAESSAGIAPSFPPPYLYVSRWDVDANPATVQGRLPAGTCVMQVAAGDVSPTTGGRDATGTVYRIGA
jgi:hypothetical protein